MLRGSVSKTMSESVTIQMEKLLQQYGDEARDVVETSAEDAANIATRQLKSTSPRGKGRRHYATGWTIKRDIAGDLISFTVYNRTKPGMTHLLENGHVVRNQYGSYGRARAIKHIAPAEEAAVQKFELRVRARLRSLR